MQHDPPPLRELGDDLRRVGRLRTVTGLSIPFIAIAASVTAAHAGMWWVMLPFAVASVFWSYASASHDLVHRNLRLPRPLGEVLLTLLELLGLRSATAYRLAHLQHHRAYPDPSDIEGHEPSHSVSAALLAGVTMQPRQWLWAFRRHPRSRPRLLLELALGMGLVAGAASLWRATPGPAIHLIAVTVVGWGLPLATVFFVHRPQERDPLRQTRMFRGRLFEVLFAGHLYHLEHHLYPSVPHQNWAKLARRLDPFLAARGIRPVNLGAGEESLPDPARAVPRADRVGRFWLDYWITFLVFLPVIVVRQLQAFARQAVTTIVTYNRTVSLLDGRLEIVYCNSFKSLLLSTLFGERFQVVRYGDKLIDPGPRFAAARVSRYLQRLRGSLSAVVVTHAHEEHYANAGAAARQLGVAVHGSQAALDAIRKPPRLSRVRAAMIGQPRPDPQAQLAGADALPGERKLVALSSDGHCDEHLSFYDPEGKVLLVGDSFMHEVFTAPNGEVNSHVWIETMKKYAALDIETMVGSHGEVTTVDEKIPEIPFVVERRDPNELIARKLAFMQWAREVVRVGEQRGLPYAVIEASLFPWSRTWSWKNFFVDEAARLLSAGEFSRTHLVRSLATRPECVPARFLRDRA